MKKTTLQDRIKLALEHSGLSKTDLWKGCGVSSGTVTTWVKGPNQTISGVNLMNAAKLLGVNPDWLATGNGAMLSSAAPKKSNSNQTLSPEIIGDSPERSILSLELKDEWLKTKIPNSSIKDLLVVFVTDNSMSPSLSTGDFLLADSKINKFTTNGVYLIKTNAGLFIKRIQRNLDGTLTLTSDSPSSIPQSIPSLENSSIEVVGKALFSWSKKDL